MLGAERLSRICEMARQNEFVSIQQLMQTFEISRSSAMRDLDELEKQGILVRRRGGAVLKDKASLISGMNEPAVREKVTSHEAEKKALSTLAEREIKDGECIYLDGGSTPLFLLEGLKNKNITIVTANTLVLSRLPDDFPGKIFLLGGSYNKDFDMSYGPLATQMIRSFRFDRCFISANGIDAASGDVTVFDFGIGEIKSEVMNRSSRKILLCDASKFTSSGICVFAEASDFDVIYSSSNPNGAEYLDNLVTPEHPNL